MSELTEAQVQAAREAGASERELRELANLKTRAQEFEAARSWLESIGPEVMSTGDTELMVMYGSLLNRADAIKSRIAQVTNTLDQALRWARGVIGLNGMRTLSGLGVVWFVPLAVMAGAAAMIGWWMKDYLRFRERFVAQRETAARLKSEGMDPAEAERQAADIVSRTAGRGFFAAFGGDMGKVFGVASVGLLALYIWNRRSRPKSAQRRRRRVA